MSSQDEAPPPPAGGEGRSNTPAPNSRVQKLGYGWTPAFGEERQKDRTRTKLRAAGQRKSLTPSENVLWKLLRSIDSYTFRRQVAVGDYVFDFGNYASRLLIEIDGAIHRLPEVQANDKAKETHAVAQGFRLLRFENNDVWDRPAWVVAEVCARLDAPHPPAPSPQGRGGEER